MRECRNAIVVWIPEHNLHTLLFGWRREGYVMLPTLQGARDANGNRHDIPADATLDRVCHAWDRKAFGLRLLHPSFPLVPDGELPQEWQLAETAIRAMEVQPDGYFFYREE